MTIDTLRAIETPEGVEIALCVASPISRAGAWAIDAGILFVGFSLAANVLGIISQGLVLLVLFVLEWMYFVLFEVFRNGVTPGKSVLGLRVVLRDGTPVSWLPSLTRNLLRAVDFLPIGYGVGLVASLFSRDGCRLGDLAAGTLVVRPVQSGRLAAVSGGVAPPAVPGAQVWAAPVPLSVEEQAVIVRFAERADGLSPERRREIAKHLEPLTGTSGEACVDRVLGLARWLER